MAVVGVPWAVENGASVHALVARVLANVASQNRQGISQPGDCKVSQTGSPSGQVQLTSGGMTILNQQSAGQSYIAALTGTTTASVDPTGGSPRSDLVMLTIVDPDFSPWQPSDVPDEVNGPYAKIEVKKGVAGGTTKAWDVVTYSALELARIDIPSNTTNITSGMIHDLRQLYRAEKDTTQLVSAAPTGNDDLSAVGSFAPWMAKAEFTVPIPSWATHYLAKLSVLNAVHYGPNGFGVLGLFLGGSGSGNGRTGGTLIASNPWAALGAQGTSDRVSVQSAITNGELALPGCYAGTSRLFDLRAYKDNASEAGYLQSDAQTRAVLEITWLQRAV